VFVTGKPFQLSLMFAGRVMPEPSRVSHIFQVLHSMVGSWPYQKTLMTNLKLITNIRKLRR